MEIYNKSLEDAARNYKMAKMAAEIATKQLETAKQALLNQTGGEFHAYGLKISQICPEPTVDWKKVREYYDLSDAKLKRFLKPITPYYKINIEKEIIL